MLPFVTGTFAQADQTGGAATPPQAVVRDLPLPDGGTQRLLFVSPNRPRGTIIMLPGGSGELGIGANGQFAHGENFVVRTRDLWTARGYAVVIPDAPTAASLRGQRASPAYAALIGQLVGFAHARSPAPVFLLGTSQGSIAAMNGAAHLAQGSIAGVVLTESVSRLGGSHETVFDADPQDVSVPALVVANRDDRCRVAPPEDAARIVAGMARSKDASRLDVQGGVTQSDDCGSLSPHGYDGIEAQVVDAIVAWMNRHP